MSNSLKVSHRLLIGFGLVIAMLGLVTVTGTREVESIDEKMTTINDINSVKQRYAINFRGSVHDRAIAIRDVVLIESDSEVQNTVAEINRLADFYKASAKPMAQMLAQNSSEKEREMIRRIEQIETKTLPLVDSIINLRLNGSTEEAKYLLLSQAKVLFIDWLAAINAFIDYQEEQNQIETSMTMDIMSSSLPQVDREIELSDESSRFLELIEQQSKQSLDHISQVVSASSKQLKTMSTLSDSLSEVISTATTMGETSINLYEKNQAVAAHLTELAEKLREHTSFFSVK